MRDWVLPAQWVPLFRLSYLLICFAATLIGVQLLRPSSAARRAAIVAAGMQLYLGVLLDAVGVRLSLWRYQLQDGLALGVPLDLHIAWALLFGVLFSVAAPTSRGAVWRYGVLWWIAAVTVDALGAPRIESLIVRQPGLGWLVGDLLLVGVLLLQTMWLFRIVHRANFALPMHGVRKLGPPRGALLRAALYLVSFGSVVCIYVPQLILSWHGPGLWPLPIWSLPARGAWLFVISVPLFFAAWAVREFTRAFGTPLPYDPPHRLVDSGPYAFVCNPMQLGVVVAMIGAAGYYRSWPLLLYALELTLLSEALFERYEVPELFARFGPAFTRYRGNVRRWLPQLHPYIAEDADELTVAYDARCSACISSVMWLKQRCAGPLRTEALPDSAQAVRVLVHRTVNGSRQLVAEYEALDACLQLMRRCPFYLAWLVPFGEFWPLRPLLQLSYRAVAETRQRDVCTPVSSAQSSSDPSQPYG